MSKYSREIRNLQYEIQHETANLRAIDRMIERMRGRKISHPSRKVDRQRIIDRFGECPANISDLKIFRKVEQENIKRDNDRIAQLKHERDIELPITPWGCTFALVRALWRDLRRARKRT
ncbi:MAG: hypothetical protein OXC27_09355 [Caldilineaceae bacterium]|nr:hypothetical protein [Caldilineaceae bacterium]